MSYFGIINSMNKLDGSADAFLSAAGITDWKITQAINNLVKDLKTSGIWSSCIAIYPFVGGTSTTMKYNLIDTTLYAITFNGGATYSSTGYLPNGTTGFANTGINASAKLTQSNASLSFYSRTNAAAVNGVCIGAIVGTIAPMVGMYLKTASTTADARNSAGAGTQSVSVSNTDSRGFYVMSKTSAAIGGLVLYKNGSSIGSNSAAITTNTYPNTNLLIGAFSSTYSFDNKECAFASIGTGLTATQVSQLNTIVTNFQTALGRNV